MGRWGIFGIVLTLPLQKPLNAVTSVISLCGVEGLQGLIHPFLSQALSPVIFHAFIRFLTATFYLNLEHPPLCLQNLHLRCGSLSDKTSYVWWLPDFPSGAIQVLRNAVGAGGYQISNKMCYFCQDLTISTVPFHIQSLYAVLPIACHLIPTWLDLLM